MSEFSSERVALYVVAATTYASFVWAVLRFFRSDNSGAKLGKKIFGILGIAMIMGCIAVLTNVPLVGTIHQRVGFALILMSLMVFWSAVITVRSKPLDFAFSINPPRGLVRSGPFAYWRHPFYASYMYAWIGTTLAGSQPLLMVPASVLGIFYLRAARAEEAALLQAYGDEYQAHRSSTGLLLPTLTRLNS